MYLYKDNNLAELEKLVDKDRLLQSMPRVRELVQKLADDDANTLFRFVKEDVDGVLENLEPKVTEEQRENCYGRVSEIDCSSIFDHIDIICQLAIND